MMLDTRTITYPLPGSIKAFVCKKDDFYTIVINDTLSAEEQYKAYQHELEHIKRGDFESDLSADLIESNINI